MPPKKKKTQLKPVARGFATTSVPKKVVPVPEEEPPARDDGQGSSSVLPEVADPHQPGPVEPARIASPIDLEQRASQSLLEKYQERIEKDITR
jgi:ATP-dependent RNA helicase DHX29